MATFDISKLSTDPSNRQGIIQESNQALVHYGARTEFNLNELQQSNRQLNEIEASEFVIDAMHDKQTANNLNFLMNQSENALFQATSQLEVQMNQFQTGLADLTRMQTELSSREDVGSKEYKKLAKDFHTLDKQLYKDNQTMAAVRDGINFIRETRNQQIKIYNDQRAIDKQSRDNTEQLARTMTLKQNLALIDQKIKGDATLAQYITQRQTLTPGELADNERDGMDLFESMWFMVHQGQNMGMFGKQQSRDMQSLYAGMVPAEQRNISMIAAEYIRSKYSGVPLSIGQYKQHLAESGELGALETVAKLSGDIPLQDTIRRAKDITYQKTFSALREEAINALPEEQKVLGLSEGQLRGIQQQAMAQVGSMNSRDVLPNLMNEVSQDVSNYTAAKGGEIFENIAQDPSTLLSPINTPPIVMEYFKSDVAKDILSKPAMETGSPITEKLTNIVDSMVANRIPRQQAVMAAADLAKNAADAAYKTRTDFGANKYSDTLSTLERLGYNTKGSVYASPPAWGKSMEERVPYDHTNPTDLDFAITQLTKFKEGRAQQQQQQQQLLEARARGTPYGAPTYRYQKDN